MLAFAHRLTFAVALIAFVAGLCLVAEAKFEPRDPKDWVVKDKAFEMQKLRNFQQYLFHPTPGDDPQWDGCYRTLLRESAEQEAKGYPSHQEAHDLILEGAKKSSEDLQQHKRYLLFIKTDSNSYRPESGTQMIDKIYTALVDMEFASTEPKKKKKFSPRQTDEWEVGDKEAEMAKLADYHNHVYLPSPNTEPEWDGPYRALLNTDEVQQAKNMGMPLHSESHDMILAAAAQGDADLQKHKRYLLFIKGASDKYRPEEATKMIDKIYTALVEMEFAADAASDTAALREAEMKKLEEPGKYKVKPGPAGGDFDSAYRSLIQTNEKAMGKEWLMSHDEAEKQILASAAQSKANVRMHKEFVIYILWDSAKYRPEEATEKLHGIYGKLLDLEFGTAAAPPASAPEKKEEPPFEGDPNLVIYRDVVYGNDDPEMQTMDVYVVKSDKPTPVLVEIHGGGWRRGDKNQFDSYKGDLIAKILDAKISVVSIQYRLTGKYPFPAPLDDAARAIQFIRTRAEDWNIDATRMAAMGGSAGAHLSAYLALHDDMADPLNDDPVLRESTRLSCFIDRAGPIDLTRMDPAMVLKHSVRGDDMSAAFTQAFDCTIEEYATPGIQRKVKAASPLYFVTPDDPPGMIMHSTPKSFSMDNPGEIPEWISDPHSHYFGLLLNNAMRDAGIETEPHLGPSSDEFRAEAVEKSLAFLQKHLKVD